MIDQADEVLLPLRHAGALVPGRPGPATLRAWADRGVRGIVLESRRIGGRRFTTREALERFLALVNGHPGSKV
jgi:Protein of unknown function (DUF1580)